MAPKKKKGGKSKICSQETFSGRRSSLQVNLSFVSSLSDSGNESLRKSQPENEFTEHERSQSNFHRRALPNIAEDTNSVECVEQAALSAINDKEQALNQNCQLLKAAILNKTRELFDRKAELAVKTATVLKDQRQALKEINRDSKSVSEKSLLSKSSLIHSPVIKKRLRSNFRSNLPSVTRISNGDKSFILSGSNKSHRKNESLKLINKELRVTLTRISDQILRTSLESSQCSSLMDEIGVPLTCSSFISTCGNRVNSSQQAESDGRKSIENSDVEEPVRRTEPSSSSLTAMEITPVQGTMPSTSRKSFTGLRPPSNIILRSRTSTNLKSSEHLEDVPMELTTVQSHIHFRNSVGSNKTARTSLNVNTSADELSYRREQRKSEGASTIPENYNTLVDRAAQISLRVNTSLGTEESPVQETESNDNSKDDRSVINNTEKSAIDRSRRRNTNSMDNTSLIARLRNLSARKSTEAVDKSKLDRFNRSSLGEEPSFVEGTPFPPSRSLLWKTQIRMENAIRNRTTRKTPVAPDPVSDSSMSTEYLTPPNNNTMVVECSPSRHTCITSNEIIQDSSEEEQPVETACPNVTIPKENTTPNIQRPGKKKLFSLQQDLQLISLSPLSPAVLSPKKPITWKPKRKLQKRKAVRAIAAKRIEALREEEEDESPQRPFLSRINTQKEKPKAKKARKVISKKIVVKKIAGGEILEQLEGISRNASDRDSTAGERSSINEFTKNRRLSTAGRIVKTEKLVIVATGFSKGDVDLVKGIVKDLGGAEINSTVSRRTTHVISTGVRTINLLRGIIRGCWLVSLDWALKSLEHEKWLNAEQYEMIHFSKAVQENRRDRQLFGKAYVPELFTTCGPIYIEYGSSPPREILKELIKTAGGRIAENLRDAKLSVGPEGLREIWILDSITTGDLQPIEEYGRN